MKSIPDGQVGLVLTDLPFGITNCAWDRQIAMEPLWAEFKRVLQARGAVALFAVQPFATDLINAARKWFRYEFVWKKHLPTGFLNAHKMPLRDHELILVFYPSLPLYRPPGVRTCKRPSMSGRAATDIYRGNWKGQWITKRTGWPTSILDYPRRQRIGPKSWAKTSAAEKPVALLDFLVRTYTRPGATVLDCCMGSGSTGVAALRAGRRFIGIELARDRFRAGAVRILRERSPGK
jgi:site-specific DNA-methyltransferase (adenine-specific)